MTAFDDSIWHNAHDSNTFLYLLRASADAVGEVTSCSDLQLYEYAQLAKAAYGSDVTTWDSATISNVGIVIG